MDRIDIGLFDFDRHNAIYYFILNSDEQIYMRYGGRDSKSATSYLNLQSLELALEQGLVLHQQYLDGELPKPPRAKPLFPRDIPLLVKNTFKRNSCVECHLIADYQALQLEQDGKLDKLSQMYRSPEIGRLGISLDVPKGLVVKESKQAAEESGIRAGDRIAAINGTTVWTFGDWQYHYAKVPRDAASIVISIERNGEVMDLTVLLPDRWWYTDLDYRNWSIDPLVYFKSRPLSEDEKRSLHLKPAGFASRVTFIHPAVKLLKRHELRVGDIVYAVDDVEHDELADTCVLHIKLRKTAGDTVMLKVIRDGKTLRMSLKTERQSFRK
jgi:hypothetical protein